LTEITIDIEAAEDSEYCDECRFLHVADEYCMLFDNDLHCDSMIQFFRCDICIEREMSDDG
jgi:hypothetical protein